MDEMDEGIFMGMGIHKEERTNTSEVKKCMVDCIKSGECVDTVHTPNRKRIART